MARRRRRAVKVLLVGVACVGKTTIGKHLAERLGCPFFDLDEEVEKFYGTSIERLQKRSKTMEEFRKKCASVLIYLTTGKCLDDFVIALPPRGLMGPYLRVVRQVDGLTVALKDKVENILSRIVSYDIDSNPIEKHLTKAEERLYLNELKADLAYFAGSYRKADLTVDLTETHGIRDAVEKVERALRAHMQSPAG